MFMALRGGLLTYVLTYLLTYVFTAKLSIARILLVACLVAKFVQTEWLTS